MFLRHLQGPRDRGMRFGVGSIDEELARGQPVLQPTQTTCMESQGGVAPR